MSAQTWNTEPQHAGQTLAARVRACLDGIPWSRARTLVRSGRVQVDGQVIDDIAYRLAPGQQVRVDAAAPKRRAGVLDPARIVYLDRDLVVVDKPAGMLTVPFTDERDTLVDQTRAVVRRRMRKHGGAAPDASLGVVQRLDKDTTGLLVFARTLAAKRELGMQLRRHSVERRYLALAHGEVESATHDTHLVPDRGDGLRGSWERIRGHRGRAPEHARRAVTHVARLERLAGASLVACRLETGRQHQIRIHLAEAGHPLVGEHVYIRDYALPPIAAPRPMLHAAVLGFVHPRTGKPLRFEAEPPGDFQDMLKTLRTPGA